MDARIQRGMQALLELRRGRLEAGERHLGWKVGFGAPAALERYAIDRPLVGFLTTRTLLDDGAEVSIGGWKAPRLEPEIAVVIGDGGAIAGLAAAIELADLDPPPEDVERILSGNIFHRHVILGAFDRGRTDADGVTMRLERDGEQIAANDAPAELTGDVVEVVRGVGELLQACGEQLRAGDVIITGSTVPPVPVAPGQRIRAQLDPLGSVSVVL